LRLADLPALTIRAARDFDMPFRFSALYFCCSSPRIPPWSAVSRYVGHDVWTMDAAHLDPARRLGVHAMRLVVVAVRASRDGLLNLRAMGLVYSTLLSLVPLLAVVFSVLKAFDAEYQVPPLLEHALAPVAPRARTSPHASWTSSPTRRSASHMSLRDVIGDPGSAPTLARLPREASH
jgi:hypothetical protein